jgi:hypothetical protein
MAWEYRQAIRPLASRAKRRDGSITCRKVGNPSQVTL